MYLCAKRLVPFIRDNIDYFAQKFSYDEKLRAKLARISSATVGRILKPEIPKHSIRGISTTRPAKKKIIAKKRIDAKVVKKYDTAKTPYCRLMESSDVPEAVKAELCRRKNNFDLQQLLETTQCLQRRLISMAQP